MPTHYKLQVVMASRLFSVDEVVASMEDRMAIPCPVDEDKWSDNEFDGYIESDVEDGNGESGCRV
jgi:hypothetical protein